MTKLSLLHMVDAGYWFCEACERATELEDDNRGGNGCAHCRSPRVVWRRPVFDQATVTLPAGPP